MYHARFLVIPVFFFCLALAQSYSATLFFACLCGILWDCENSIAPSLNGDNVDPVDNLRFGYSVFLFGITGFGIKYVQAILPLRGWGIYVPIVFIFLTFYLLLEYLMILFVRGGSNTDHRFLYQILYSSILSITFAPLILTGLKFIHRIFNPWEKGNLEGFEHFISKHHQ